MRRAPVLLAVVLAAVACRNEAARANPEPAVAPPPVAAPPADPRATAVCDGWEALVKRCPDLDRSEPRERCLRTYSAAFADTREKETAEAYERCVLGGGDCPAVAACLDEVSGTGLYPVTTFTVAADCTSDAGRKAPHPLLGTPAKLDALAPLRGTPVVVTFTATWESSFPNELSLLKKLQGADVVLVLSNTAQEVGAISLPPEMKVVVDASAGDGALGPITKQWGIRAVPESLLVDAAGVIRHHFVQAHDWSSASAAACMRSVAK